MPLTYGTDNEHSALRAQIEELKVGLEHAQMSRKRKIEYDLVAEKVNTLPSREELESLVSFVFQTSCVANSIYQEQSQHLKTT